MSVQFEYAIESVKLTTAIGVDYEIRDLVIGVDFYESINSPYIKCEMAIGDAANLIETAPIVGQEKIDLVIKDFNTNKTIKRSFYISSIQNYKKSNNQASLYTLKLVTPEYMMNSLNLVSQAYTGTISDSVEKIVKDYLKGKMAFNEKSTGTYSVIVPSWNPYKAIEWISRKATSGSNYPYVFYETLFDGYRFESYENIMNKTSVVKYVHRSNSEAKDDARQKGALMSTALTYDIVQMSNTGKNILRGTFGQALYTIDHANRSYTYQRYDYNEDFKKRERLEKFPYVVEDFKVDEKSISKYDAVQLVAYKNPLAFNSDSINNYNNKIEITKLQADPFVYQTDLVKINMTVKGRCNLSVGQVVDFEVERNRPVVYGTNKNANEYLSGKYIIQNIHHKLEQGKYFIVMDVIKESLGKKVK